MDSGKEKTRDDMGKIVVKPWGKGPGESLHAMPNKAFELRFQDSV